MRRQGIDYFENTRRAIYAQRSYAKLNPMRWSGYGENVWGMTGSDGPAVLRVNQGNCDLEFHAYAARGIGRAFSVDDGTIAPSAAIASMAFAPESRHEPRLVDRHDRELSEQSGVEHHAS